MKIMYDKEFHGAMELGGKYDHMSKGSYIILRISQE